ncbi:MAG: hypothetical protein IH600_11920, partial [Bacteroidetes bacterium]|nr:hypothetical protein [Bacteroidota bacterium]
MKSLVFVSAILLVSLQGCAVVRSVAGANVDHERYEKAREAASLETRYRGALLLADRLQKGDDPTKADIVVQLQEEFLVRTLQQLCGREGWLDAETRYRIDSVAARMFPGSALVTLNLLARSEGYGVDVRLLMDCQLALIPDGDALLLEIEPYNVTPAASAGGLLAPAERLIEDVIRVKLGTMKEQFPPMRLPLGFDDNISIDGTSSKVKGTPNLVITAPRRIVDYKLRVKDVLLFDRIALVGINLESIA